MGHGRFMLAVLAIVMDRGLRPARRMTAQQRQFLELAQEHALAALEAFGRRQALPVFAVHAGDQDHRPVFGQGMQLASGQTFDGSGAKSGKIGHLHLGQDGC